ncbi:MAG: helix-turn-helix transcriptional regulator [Nitrospira sp. CG24B]|nr:MAG: helix-turn-helix transcriptional regulator [Nitrospira sp. CG24B]
MQARKVIPEVILGQEIARLRRRIGISQEELGFRAEVHRTYISQLERGLKSPTLGILLKLSRALKIPASTIVDHVDRESVRK